MRNPSSKSRREHLKALSAGLLGAAAPHLAFGQAFPSQPIKLLIPYAAGGGTDLAARTIAQQMGVALGQSIVPDNKAGAGGTIALDAVARSRPDGYTLGVGNIGPLAIAQAVRNDVPYDVARDFSFVGAACLIEMVLVVRPGLDIRSFEQLLAHARNNPGKLTYGVSGGLGTSIHLQMEYLKALAGVNIVPVPYRGEAPVIADMLGGHLDVGLVTTSLATSYVKAGKVHALVLPAMKRSRLLPDVPLDSETKAGVEFKAYSWSVLVAAANTPPAILGRLNGALNSALKYPEVAEKLLSQGFVPMGGTPEEASGFVRREQEKWGKIARDNKIRA